MLKFAVNSRYYAYDSCSFFKKIFQKINVSPQIGRTSVPKKISPNLKSHYWSLYYNMCKKLHYFKEIALIVV